MSGMNNTQRQQLLYFATGTAALPATSDGGETGVCVCMCVYNVRGEGGGGAL